MKSRFARRVVVYGTLACALTACSLQCLALDPALDVVQYAHTAWRVRDGFAKGAIQAIAQTPDGYLWLGTEFGLLRFDGVRATPWRSPQGQQLPDDDIASLLASDDGTLWIGTLKGLASWRAGKLTQYPELFGFAVSALLQDRERTVWVGTLSTESPGRLCAIQTGTVACQGIDDRFDHGFFSLYERRDGTLWAGSAKGLWRWKPGPPQKHPLPSSEPNGAMAIARDEDDALLVGVDSGLKRAVGREFDTYRLPSSLQPKKIYRLLRDRGGSLWIGTVEGGIWHVHRGRTDTFATSDGLSGDFVACIFEDREGSIWVGTTEGLDRFHNLAAATFSAAQGLNAPGAASVLPARDGSVWVAAFGGLNRWNGKALTAWPGSNRTGARPIPNSLYEDSRARIWVSQVQGLGYIDKGRFISIPAAPRGYVHAMAEDAPDSLWISTQDLGIFHVVRMEVVQQIPWSALGHRQDALSMVPDRSGGLWLGFADGGVARFAEGKIVTSYSAADGLAAGMISDLLLDERGVLWASAEGGLSRIRSDRIETITRKDGLPCDRVRHLLEDDDHAFWLFMACGLVRVDRSEVERRLAARSDLAGGSPALLQTRVFDESDGVRLPAFMVGYNPKVAKSGDGKLWFATNPGFSVIDPRQLPANPLPPPVHVERITGDRQLYEALPHLRLPPLIRDLQIDYTALSLVAPEKVQFRYKLEGRDRDWQSAGTRRQAFYTDLAPGQYRFRVVASNNSGVWNEQGDALDFSIAPAYWQTNWFRSMCAAAFLALLWLAHWLRARHLANQFNRTLDARVTERTRIARELHDTLLQSFQGLLLRFQTALEQVPPQAAQARKTLEQAIDQAAQTITEGRDAVQGLRAPLLETNDLALSLRTFGEELAADGGSTDWAGVLVVVEGLPRTLYPILRDEVYRIGCEAMRNALRHAAAKQIEVELRYDDRQLRLRLRDDGKGIDPKYLGEQGREGHFGLHGMRERAELIGGKLTVWSAPDAGTEVELTVPADLAYAAGPERRRSPLLESIFSKEG